MTIHVETKTYYFTICLRFGALTNSYNQVPVRTHPHEFFTS